MATLESQVSDPSVAAGLFQCHALLERIATGFPASEYPAEAICISRIFEIIARRVERQLLALQTGRGSDSGTNELLPLEPLAAERANHFGKLIRTVYGCFRFLASSDPQSTPPEIQTAIRRLIKEYVNPVVANSPGVTVLVRPRWSVPNFVDLLGYLEQTIEVADLDPDGDTGAQDLRSLIGHDWATNQFDGTPPTRVAVISFAGIDAHDALLYPILAHELGHFLTAVVEGPQTDPAPLSPKARPISLQEVQTLFDAEYPVPVTGFDRYRQERVHQLHQHANQLVVTCLLEIVADLLATRMLGVPYFISLAEYLKTVSDWPEEVVTESGYPGIQYRLRLIFEELTDPSADIDAVTGLESVRDRAVGDVQSAIKRTVEYLRSWQRRLIPPPGPQGARLTSLPERIRELARERVEAAVPGVVAAVRNVIPKDRVPPVAPHLSDLILLLQHRVAPAQPLLSESALHEGPPDAKFSDVLAAGWIYELGIGELCEERLGGEAAFREYQNTCQLLFKAIELQDAREAVLALDSGAAKAVPVTSATPVTPSGVASGPGIVSAMLRTDLATRLFVVPYFGAGPVNAATLDLRLGNWFRIARRTRSTAIDLSDSADRMRIRREAQQEEYVRFGGAFALHPGDFALGVSLEYYAIPPDLMAFVEGKSSLGRTGLIVATATQVAPGFKGGIVLELFNSGTVPLLLRPGMSIAQLVLVHTDRSLPTEWVYSGRFRCQVKP